MLTHLLFSIAALIFLIIFMITYFSYKKNTNMVRSQIYVFMIWCALALTLIEIVEGFTYVYNVTLVFSLMWKLHSIVLIVFVASLFYYFLSLEYQFDTIVDVFWDEKKTFSLKNLFSILFLITIIVSVIYVKTYPMRLTMFYFYTAESINMLLILTILYIFYTFYILYIKSNQNSSFEVNDYIILIGTFILFVIAIIFEYRYPEISVYSTLFTLVLILLYYFKENEDLLIIEQLLKVQDNLIISNEKKLKQLNDIVNDIELPFNSFVTTHNELLSCNDLSDIQLNEELEKLNSVCNSFFDILNINNHVTKYRIDKIVSNIEEIAESYVMQKPIEFKYYFDKNLPSLLIGDSVAIQRIISELVINAIKNTNVGKISLSITGERYKDEILLKIVVSDTGIGIKKEDFSKVFSKEIDSEHEVSNLAFIKKYVDDLKGRIYFESYYGAGTTFYVDLPQKIGSDLSLLQVPIVRNIIQGIDCNHKRILLLDMEDYSSKKMCNILKKYNLDIKCVISGVEAINTIKCDDGYDLIIITDNINDMDFMKIGQLLRQLSKYVKVPPVLANVVARDVNDDHFDNTFDEVLQKPLDLKELDEIIQKRFV